MGFPDYKVQYLALNGTNNYFTEPTDCLRKPSRRLSHNETIRSKSAVRMLIRPSARQTDRSMLRTVMTLTMLQEV